MFYTNSNSRKGRELEQQGHAAMVMHWAPLERQVRVEGTVEMLDSAESDEYFHSCVLPHMHGLAFSEPAAPPLHKDDSMICFHPANCYAGSAAPGGHEDHRSAHG